MAENSHLDTDQGFSKGKVRNTFFAMRVAGAAFGFVFTWHNVEAIPNAQNPAIYALVIGILGVIGAILYFGYNRARSLLRR